MSVFIEPRDAEGFKTGYSIVLDITVSETHSVDYEITDFPRESTTDASDNIIRKPRVLRLNLKISDDIAGKVGELISETLLNNLPYSQLVWAYFKALADSKLPLFVDTSLEQYYPMYIERLGDAVRDKTSGKALVFSLTLREIITVYSDTTAAQQPAEGTSDRTKKTVNQNKKSPKPENLNQGNITDNKGIFKKLYAGYLSLLGGE